MLLFFTNGNFSISHPSVVTITDNTANIQAIYDLLSAINTNVTIGDNRLSIINENLLAIKNALLDSSTQTAILNQINQNGQAQLDEQKKQTDAITNAANQSHQDSLNQQEAINNQTKQEQDRYDKDKQEESDRENQGNEEADKAGSIFNISLANPFSAIFSLFHSPDSCASIPIISSFVGSSSSTYCSWWPSSVRSVLTPAFGIVSMMLLFGFVMRWLGGSATFHLGGD